MRNQIDITVGANATKAKSTISDLGSAIKKFKNQSVGGMFNQALGSNVGGGSGGLMGIFGALKGQLAAFGGMMAAAFATKHIIEAGVEMRAVAKAAERLGVPVEFMENLNIAAGKAGASLEDAEKMMVFLGRSAQAALREPDGEKGQAFKALGVSLSELRDMKPTELFEAISNSVAGASNQTAALSHWMDVAGKGGYSMWGAVRMGADTISKLNPLAKANTESMSEMGKAWSIVKREATTFGNVIAGIFSPVLTALFKGFSSQLARISMDFERLGLAARLAWRMIKEAWKLNGWSKETEDLLKQMDDVERKQTESRNASVKAGDPESNRMGDQEGAYETKAKREAIDNAKAAADKAESEANQKQMTELERIAELEKNATEARTKKSKALADHGEDSLEYQKAREAAANADKEYNSAVRRLENERAEAARAANNAELDAAYEKLSLEEKILYQVQLQAEAKKRMANLPEDSKKHEWYRKTVAEASKSEDQLRKDQKKKRTQEAEHIASTAHASRNAGAGLGGYTNAVSAGLAMQRIHEQSRDFLKSIDKKMDNLNNEQQLVLQ